MRFLLRVAAVVLAAGAAGVGVLAAVLVALLATASPASAHVGGGPSPSNWRSPVASVHPAMSGVTVRTVDNGDSVEVVNHSSVVVMVLGYDGEPYLRFRPDGVDENTRSAATYLNRTKDGRTEPPADARDPKAPPSWRKVAEGPKYRWHDHRTHWMQTRPPPVVQANPSAHQVIAQWTVPMRYGDTEVTVAGTLSWVPGPNPWPSYGIAAGLALAGAALGWLRRWRVPAVVAVGVLVAADVIHSVGEGLSGVSAADIPAWAAGVWAVVAVLRRSMYAPLILGLLGAVVALVSGVGDLGVLTHSQLPFTGPTWLARLCVAVALGLGTGLVVACWRLSRIRRGEAAADTLPDTEPEAAGLTPAPQ